MITPFQMYMLCMLDNIHSLATIVLLVSGGIAGVAGFIGAIMKTENMDDESSAMFYASKTSFSVFLVCLALMTFLPNTKQMAAIVVVPKIVNNEKIQDCASSLVALANDWMKELSPKKDGEK